MSQTVTRSEGARLAGRSVQWVTNLTDDGHLTRVSRGQYDLSGFIQGVIAYYESRLEDSTKADAANKATIARTREIELRIHEQHRRELWR